LRIYIIMLKALIMWLNIQLFQFLITDYPRYNDEWQAIQSNMALEQHQRADRRRYARQRAIRRNVCADTACHLTSVCNPSVRGLDDTEDDEDPSLSSMADHGLRSGSSSSSSDSSESSSTAAVSGCCDFNLKGNAVEYESTRSERYNKWCNERYFKALRPPLAILHEIMVSYPRQSVDHCNVYNLSQRHLYRYSNETFQRAASDRNAVYAFSAIALYGWTVVHTVLFWVCYHWGFRQHAEAALSFVFVAEYVALYTIYGMIIFNVLHCDRLLDVIKNTSWFDDRLLAVIRSSLLGDRWRSQMGGDGASEVMDAAVMARLKTFHVHHQRMVQITLQHYMMLHILNLILQRSWLCELIMEYLYGFHPFCDGDIRFEGLIKNIIRGGDHEQEPPGHREWSPSESQSNLEDLQRSNLDDEPIPTDSNLMGISQRIIERPNIERENAASPYDGGNLLNDFMEQKYVENRRTSADGMCVCHEEDRGFLAQWDEINLMCHRVQYDAFRKGRVSQDGEQSAVEYQHQKICRSIQFYFDFIRTLHHQRMGVETGD